MVLTLRSEKGSALTYQELDDNFVLLSELLITLPDISNRLNWVEAGYVDAVVGQLAWKNYGNDHTIFDASAGTSPNGTAVNNTNSDGAWTASYPTLMGWNGTQTYGVRVDSARIADTVRPRTWTAVSRAFNTNYTNTTGSDIEVFVGLGANVNFAPFTIYVGGVNLGTSEVYAYTNSITFTVPNGAVYQVAASNMTLAHWKELR